MTSFYRPTIAAIPEMDLVAKQRLQDAGLGPDDLDAAVHLRRLHPDRPVAARVASASAGRGEAKDFVKDGALELGGRLPNNTHGGQLSEAYIHGMNGVNEGVRLVRGTLAEPAGEERPRAGTAGVGVPTSAMILGKLCDTAQRPCARKRRLRMREAVIVEALRTPIARGKAIKGALSAFHPAASAGEGAGGGGRRAPASIPPTSSRSSAAA